MGVSAWRSVVSSLERSTVKLLSNVLSKKHAYRIAKALLATQGIGWAGPEGGLKASGEANFIHIVLKGKTKPTVFDVGGNQGHYTKEILETSPEADIHIFEPSTKHVEVLHSRYKSNKNIKINGYGLSNRRSQKMLYKDQEISGMASLLKRNLQHINIKMNLEEKVKLEIGDNYCKKYSIRFIDLLKIDVEGWEMPVLRGFHNLLAKGLIGMVQFEFGHCHLARRENFMDFFAFFRSYGYVIGIIKPTGMVNWLSDYDEIHENYYASNYVAKKKGKKLY